MDYYSKIADGYDELYGEEQRKKVKKIVDRLNISDESILDVGCGSAVYADLFKNYCGIDISKGLLKKAKGNVVYGKAEKLPFKDRSFDVVICVTAIHNFKDPKKAILEMKRVSKGKIAITLLRKSRNFIFLEQLIKQNLNVQIIEEDKDIIYIQDS